MKFANGLIKKIPGKVLTEINQKVGFRFITKFGTKGIVNLGKLLPGVGAVVGRGLDLVETKVIADRAYKWFLKLMRLILKMYQKRRIKDSHIVLFY